MHEYGIFFSVYTKLLYCALYEFRLAISTTGTSTRLPLVLDRSFKVEDDILKISRVKQELPESVQQQKIKASSKVLEKEESLESTSAFVSGKPVSGSLATKYPLGTRQAKKYYVRDSLTLPGMVVLYNTLLVWALFNIDVRASSL